MIKKLQSILCAFVLMFGFMAPLAAPVGVLAAPIDDACDGLELTGTGTCDKAVADLTFAKQVQNIINILSILVGVVAVIMIIIGGFRYVTSNGDANSTKGAKDAILYAIVGLVIVIFAQVIIRFVITNV